MSASGVKVATFVKKAKGFRGDARVYRLSEPLEGHSLVIVSAVTVPLETYIFPANYDGSPIDFGELPGSVQGTLQHSDALAAAGYVVEGEEVSDERAH